ncbi:MULTISPECIES: DoxX family protein [Paraburkholderia]|uniref:DoxX family protein n=1 Tax=Paraburkholderia TaxID=1822464 RepID=UPI0022553B6A|nr:MULTISPECIES: DoxX family protein [Paraburkholderia]MCX4162894.1 DoxX family protein [Paraburkholderia megapolitana]MDN7158390.1 DoxX family protein [Paraburkholderia sp. CHISQ3]MDQ6495437.1 DoxX family protein [Paraburkholderia megapolitana]
MTWFDRVVSRETAGTDLLRVVVCAILFTHGAYRIYLGEVSGFGALLQDSGVPAGLLVAWLVCIAETVGTVLLALRILVFPISLILSAIYFVGVAMFNWQRGFFVVGGHANGGWEYNALLITCLLVTTWANWGRKWF